MNWNLSEAKNRLSEVLNLAEDEAQTIVRRDREYVILTGDEYRKLKGEFPSFKDWLLEGPSLEGLDLERDRSPMREVAF